MIIVVQLFNPQHLVDLRLKLVKLPFWTCSLVPSCEMIEVLLLQQAAGRGAVTRRVKRIAHLCFYVFSVVASCGGFIHHYFNVSTGFCMYICDLFEYIFSKSH